MENKLIKKLAAKVFEASMKGRGIGIWHDVTFQNELGLIRSGNSVYSIYSFTADGSRDYNFIFAFNAGNDLTYKFRLVTPFEAMEVIRKYIDHNVGKSTTSLFKQQKDQK